MASSRKEYSESKLKTSLVNVAFIGDHKKQPINTGKPSY